MKRIGCGALIMLAFLIIVLVEFFPEELKNWLPNTNLWETNEINEKLKEHTNVVDEKEKATEPLLNKESSLHQLIGVSSSDLTSIFQEPARIEPSAYGYDWWIYDINPRNYVQFGMFEDRVVTIYAIGDEMNTEPFYSQLSYQEVENIVEINQNVSFHNGINSYRFELTEADLITRPLIHYDGVWIQLYFDQFTRELSSIRYLDDETLLKHRPYSIVYRGELPEELSLTNEQWEEIERANEKQILAITNVIRNKHGLPELEWEENVASVAYKHSKDMGENRYFSHTSPQFGELTDRLEADNIRFYLAGENIAAEYVDGIAAVEGWLNSEGHRVNLLSEEFTHLGVGVYRKCFTQNFLTPWDIIHQ